MPQLTALQCALLSSAEISVTLHPKLTSLPLDLSTLDAGAINAALMSIGQLATLAELHVSLRAWLPDVSFAPLSAVLMLRELSVSLELWCDHGR